jgi:hypothetical protein
MKSITALLNNSNLRAIISTLFFLYIHPGDNIAGTRGRSCTQGGLQPLLKRMPGGGWRQRQGTIGSIYIQINSVEFNPVVLNFQVRILHRFMIDNY